MSIKLGANVVPQFKLGILNLNKIMLGAIEIFPNLASGGGFDPSDWFVNGEQGFFYNLANSAWLFQSTLSMEPVTSASQPMGVVVDGSQKYAPGSEMLSNNDFDNGWTIFNPAIAVIVGTTLEVNQPTGTTVVAQHPVSPTWVLGTVYEITFVISAYTSGTIAATDVFAGATPVGVSGVGTHKQYYFCQRADFPNTRLNSGFSGFVGTIDSVSIKPIASIANATQPTASARPMYDVVGSSFGAILDGVNDLLNVALNTSSFTEWTVAAQWYNTRSYPGGMTLLGTFLSSAGFICQLNASNRIQGQFGNGSGVTAFTSTNEMALGEIAVSAWTYDGSVAGISKNNNTPETLARAFVPQATQPPIIGVSPHDVNTDMAGGIVSLVLINRKLTEAELTEYYNWCLTNGSAQP
jgi:hypothetical protein